MINDYIDNIHNTRITKLKQTRVLEIFALKCCQLNNLRISDFTVDYDYIGRSDLNKTQLCELLAKRATTPDLEITPHEVRSYLKTWSREYTSYGTYELTVDQLNGKNELRHNKLPLIHKIQTGVFRSHTGTISIAIWLIMRYVNPFLFPCIMH
jgi:hypothetical protein